MTKIDHLQTVEQFKITINISMVKYYLYKMHTGENFMHTLKKLLISLSGFLLLCLIGCSTGPTEKTYCVYTLEYTSAQFSEKFSNIELEDGEFENGDLTKVFDLLSSSTDYANKGKHWTEKQITDYLISIGFSETDAAKETDWLLEIPHGQIIKRTGNTYYEITK